MGFNDSIYCSDLTHRAVAVYMYLKDRANRDRQCFPSIQTIANALSLSKRTVQRAVRDLEKAGFIRTEQRWRKNGGRSSLLFFIEK